jgi:hypothetical protein
VFNFRSTTEDIRKVWARLLRARVLPDRLRDRYMAFR